eukprot:CAMPEP_0172599732 /NCGR_PEP_ID=MMETSP1068-20121228/19849_1 /TAXON_ID=35684 /ORGANISM="Pseudopedinella elastica, Strain CCMP716" /LENGTH=59 /DNA_ID=CAMNT_0013400087 /DNA_START=1011 /DNA_END=1186 /DNA_ORIENTATION=+
MKRPSFDLGTSILSLLALMHLAQSLDSMFATPKASTPPKAPIPRKETKSGRAIRESILL